MHSVLTNLLLLLFVVVVAVQYCVAGMRSSSLVNPCWNGWSPFPCPVAFRHPNPFSAHQFVVVVVVVWCCCCCCTVLCGRYEEQFPGESLLERLVTFSLPCGLQASQSIHCSPVGYCVVVVVVVVVAAVVVVVVVVVFVAVVVVFVAVVVVVVVNVFVVVVVVFLLLLLLFYTGKQCCGSGMSGSPIPIFQSGSRISRILIRIKEFK
jgi:hypothetical protein